MVLEFAAKVQKIRLIRKNIRKFDKKICLFEKISVTLSRFLGDVNEMTILCIETSTSTCSAAICQDGVAVAWRIEREQANHARTAPLMVEELLKAYPTIDAVALSGGPGSYTGLRIGTSLAKGLCYGRNIPLLAIDTLSIICASALAQAHVGEGLLCPMTDARRMEIYTNLYDLELAPQGEVHAQIVEDGSWLPEKGDIYYFGDGASKCQAILADPRYHYIDGIVPDARYMGVLAEEVYKKNPKGEDVAYYEPFYLKQFVAAPSHVKGLK